MKIVIRHFLKEFFVFFTVCLLSVSAILVIAEFFDKFDEFYTNKASISLVVQYLLLQLPRSILIASPIASLLSILFTIGMAAKWKETVAIRASGGSIKRLFSYFLTLGIIISLCVLVFGETLVPMAASRASWLRNTQILKNESRITFREGMLWLKGLDGSLIRIQDFVEDKNRILKISIFGFSPSFELISRTEAAEGEWADGKWELKDATVFDFENDTVTKYDSYTFSGLDDPGIFKKEMKKTEEMSFRELYHYYKRLERAGFKNNRYVVELYGKLAHPMVNFVMIMFGIALALNSRWGGGVRSAGLGLVVIIVYLMVFAVSVSLGNTGALPPALAPWISPAIFCITGSYMFINIRE